MTDVLSPVTEEVVATVPAATREETDAAIARAASAFEAWRAVGPGDRGRLLRRFSSNVGDHIEELAQLEVRNSGHTIGNARWEAGNVRDVLAYYSAAPERLVGQQIPVPGGMNVTMADGSVRNVSDRIGDVAWVRACNPQDGQPMPNDW